MLLPSECYVPSSNWGSTLIKISYSYCLLQPIVSTSCELAAVTSLKFRKFLRVFPSILIKRFKEKLNEDF